MSSDRNSAWGNPPEILHRRRRRWDGYYDRASYAGAGRIGPREFASTFAFGAVVQPVVLATSAAIELLAERAYPGMSVGRAGIASYFIQMVFAMAMKSVAGMFRSYGSSMIRDIGAWAWIRFIEPVIYQIKVIIAPETPSVIDPDNPPKPPRRRRILDWLFPPRN